MVSNNLTNFDQATRLALRFDAQTTNTDSDFLNTRLGWSKNQETVHVTRALTNQRALYQRCVVMLKFVCDIGSGTRSYREVLNLILIYLGIQCSF